MSESEEVSSSETQQKQLQNLDKESENSQEDINDSRKKEVRQKSKSGHGSVPKDKVALKLILASGKSSEFIFPHFASVGEVTEFVYKNWPEEWLEEKESITSHHILRLIYQGRFLHENVTFTALNLAPGKRTVMHLVPREKLPQLSSDDMEKVPKTSERSCCCNIL